MSKFDPKGEWYVYLLKEEDALTNCLKAIAEFRKETGEYWPAKILLPVNSRIPGNWGEGIEIIYVDDRWIINNAIYMSLTYKLYDPVQQRKAIALESKRDPVEDVYQVYYRMRHTPAYVLSLPKRSE